MEFAVVTGLFLVFNPPFRVAGLSLLVAEIIFSNQVFLPFTRLLMRRLGRNIVVMDVASLLSKPPKFPFVYMKYL
jgi:hypothetical protein